MEKIKQALGDHKISGGHTIFKECPVCKRTKYKFYVNFSKGVFDCKSASCGATGHLNKLRGILGIPQLKYKGSPQTQSYATEETKELVVNIQNFKPISVSQEFIDYFQGRGISSEVLAAAKVWYDPAKNMSVFPAVDVEKEQYLGIHFRGLKKNFQKAPGSKQHLWGRHIEDKESKVAYITEGEIDALTLMQMGYSNVFSMPQGANSLGWIDNDFEYLQRFETLYLLYDNDEAGKVGLEKASKRLDFCSLKTIDYKIYKDINDFFLEDEMGLRKAIETPVHLMSEGIRSVTEVRLAEMELHSWGCDNLNHITGGARYHEITVFTASPGSGKTTFLCNMIANLMEIGEKAFLYSGELNDSTTKNWLYSVIAGREGIEYRDHPFRAGERIGMVNREVEAQIDLWVKDRLFLHKGELANGFKLIEDIKKFHKQAGISYFFLDNLSVIDLGEGNKWGDQSKFAKELMGLVKDYPIHIFIVAHPKKPLAQETDYIKSDGTIKAPARLNKYDIAGSADIINLCHSVLVLERANEHWKAWYREQMPSVNFDDLGNILYLDKNRNGGFVMEDVLYKFDVDSKRFSAMADNKVKKYSYDALEVESLEDLFGVMKERFDIDSESQESSSIEEIFS